MTNDTQLLRRYLDERSQEAFAELVRHHVGWVYHAALRRTGGRHDLAQEVAQYVFTAVANHADSLSQRDSLVGWLHVTTRYAAGRVLRSEVRRRRRETVAHTMTEIEHSTRDPEWEQIRPALDELLDKLPAGDRETLFLRFYEGMALAEIGVTLALSEDGVRKRVDRALEKLRGLLARRGIASTSAALGTLLSAQANAAVSGEIQAAVTTAALSGGAAPGASVLGLLHFMNATKVTLGGIGVAAGLLCIGIMGMAVEQTARARRADAALAEARRQTAIVRDLSVPALSFVSSVPPVAPPARVIPAPQVNAVARADAKAFLAAFGGSLGEQYRARSRREIEQRYALFFVLAELPEEKRRLLVDRTVQRWEDSLEVTPGSILAKVDTLDETELRAVLGDDGYRQWYDLVVRAEVAKTWSMEIAKAASASTEPLSTGQIVALHRIVREQSPEYGAGGKIDDRTVDWEAVGAHARKTLSDGQWQHAQTYLAMREAMRALERLAEAGRSSAANPP